MPSHTHPGDPRPSGPEGRTRAGGVVRSRCRSFCFLERERVRWTVFLLTYLRPDGQWRGYFTFRSAADGLDQDEIRTADLFVEQSEQDVDSRARGLGRPLLLALLESALDTYERRRGFSPDLQRWFRELIGRHVADRAPTGGSIRSATPANVAPSLVQLRSLYDTYRLDQVAHLIALMAADDFKELVEVRLEGRRIDFQARDRFQLAMFVVQDIERRLPLPPFEVWVEDYLARPEEYIQYARELHREGDLP
jgi:hypothetical protein